LSIYISTLLSFILGHNLIYVLIVHCYCFSIFQRIGPRQKQPHFSPDDIFSEGPSFTLGLGGGHHTEMATATHRVVTCEMPEIHGVAYVGNTVALKRLLKEGSDVDEAAKYYGATAAQELGRAGSGS
jgi:hypothetical protein